MATIPNMDKYVDNVSPSYGPGGIRDVVACYHTHGKCTKGCDNDHFSYGYPRSDLQQADWHLPLGVPSYLDIQITQQGKPCPCGQD